MFFALGPVTTIGEVHTPLRFLAYLTPELEVGYHPRERFPTQFRPTIALHTDGVSDAWREKMVSYSY